jgi:plasmid maintenance system antidote protein VapI
MSPQEFLKALLIEDNLTQKSLVPICFHTESQVSEFMHRKKGRDKLSYEQAVHLGNMFKVDPLNFLSPTYL